VSTTEIRYINTLRDPTTRQYDSCYYEVGANFDDAQALAQNTTDLRLKI